MDLTTQAMDRVVELTRQADGKIVELGGVAYSTVKLHDPRSPDPCPELVPLHTLSGLTDYLKRNRDGVGADNVTVHVRDPETVDVWSGLFGHFRQRCRYVVAVPELPAISFGVWLSQEAFVIAVATQFTDAGDRAKVLQLAGNLSDEEIRTLADDGVTQQATAKSGVRVVETVKVPNPVSLAPYRTFQEVEQVASPFLFRVRKGHHGPELALFEADGGSWRIEAITRVRDHLRAQLSGWDVIA